MHIDISCQKKMKAHYSICTCRYFWITTLCIYHVSTIYVTDLILHEISRQTWDIISWYHRCLATSLTVQCPPALAACCWCYQAWMYKCGERDWHEFCVGKFMQCEAFLTELLWLPLWGKYFPLWWQLEGVLLNSCCNNPPQSIWSCTFLSKRPNFKIH